MSNRSRAAALVLCTLALSGCASSMPPVPVLAGNGELAPLTGTWVGSYEMNTGSRRSGSIIFELLAGRDSAAGSVVMTYTYADALPVAVREEERHMHTTRSEALAISFVRLAGAGVAGELADYTDPYCGCRLKTTFTGTVRADMITGNFVTVHLDSGYTDRGKWRVVREGMLPVVMSAAVVLTANHYFLDGLAGAAIVLASYAWAVTRERRTDALSFATTVSATNEAEYRGRP